MAGSPGPEPTQDEPRCSEKSSSRKSTQEASCPLTPSTETKGLHVVTGLTLPCQELDPEGSSHITETQTASGSLNKHLWHECLREEERMSEQKQRGGAFYFNREATVPKHPERPGVQSWGRQSCCSTTGDMSQSPKLLKRTSPLFCRRNELERWTEALALDSDHPLLSP